MDFWGLRKTGSKGMRFYDRMIWHYFTYQKTWARGEGMFTICHANWDDGRITEKREDRPPRKDCCAQCYTGYNKRQKVKVVS